MMGTYGVNKTRSGKEGKDAAQLVYICVYTIFTI